MNKHIFKTSMMAVALLLCTGTAQAVVTELAVNGDFETGDLTGWTIFDNTNASNGGVISVTSPGSAGAFAGNTNGNSDPSGPGTAGPNNPAMKQANVGIGLLTPGQAVTVSFDWKVTESSFGNVFAALQSEQAGGGASQTDIILGGAVSTSGWTNVSTTINIGPDVAEGISLELVAICGGEVGCQSNIFWDNISITADVAAVPVPAAAWLFGSGLLGLIGVARRKKAA